MSCGDDYIFVFFFELFRIVAFLGKSSEINEFYCSILPANDFFGVFLKQYWGFS